MVALLLESNEIKVHKPKYNRRQRRTMNHSGIFKRIDEFGYINFIVEGIKNEVPLVAFNSAKEAKERLYNLTEKYHLCQKLCGLYEASGSCFFYQIKKCKGACVQEEAVVLYNNRAQKMLEELCLSWKNFIVIDKGRNENERAIIKVSNGSYIGFGYADLDFINQNIEDLTEVIKKYPDNKDIQQIIKTYLRQHNVEKLIKF